MFRYGARNRFQEPSLELSSLATYRLAGRYDNPMPTWFLAPIAGLKLQTQATWVSGPVRKPYSGVDFIPQSGIYGFGYRTDLAKSDKKTVGLPLGTRRGEL